MTFGCHDPRCHVRAGARGRGGSASVTVSDMRTRADVLVTATELMALIESGDAPAVLDVRWQLNEPDGRPAYLQGHIPGAVYVSLDDDLADHTRTGRGRHPLPSGVRCRRLHGAGVCGRVSRWLCTTTGIVPALRGRGGC